MLYILYTPILLIGMVCSLVLLPTAAQKPSQGEVKLPRNSMLNLYDAFGKRDDLYKDFGFSTLINYNGKIILFDAGGHADHFRENVRKLGVNLRKVDFVIISHTHPDHLNGIDYLLTIHPKVKIYFPEDLFYGTPAIFDATGTEETITDSLPAEMRYYKRKDLVAPSGRFWKANIEYIKTNKEIIPGVKLVVTASPYMGYFSKYPKSFLPDYFQDSTARSEQSNSNIKFIQLAELSLSMNTPQGEVVVVGCSHSSVEKIIEATIAYTNQAIALVFGGFHMIPFSRPEITALGKYIKDELKVKKLAPAHCTGHLAFKLLRDIYGSDYVYAGEGELLTF
jgi:7,8-dihydropterin-6-yl-methyl-4-(beta-D-ribofuranosyl)aminobenzene 5'-phosphate synthase